MISVFRSALSLLKERSVPLWIYAFLFLASTLLAGLSSDHFENADGDVPDLFLLVGLPAFLANIVAFWFLIRKLGNANSAGSVIGWIAWSIPIAFVYGILLIFWLEAPIDVEEISWPAFWAMEALLIASSLAIGCPFLLVSTGRVLDTFGPSVWKIFLALRGSFLSFFTAVFGSYFAGYFCYEAFRTNFGLVANNDLQAFLIASIGGIFEFLAIISVTAVSVVVYQKVERELAGQAASL